MAQQPIPEGIEVISAQGQRQGSIDKTDLDLEIERYQREIDDKQRKQRQVSSPQQPHDAHQPFSPSAPRAESYEVYEPISPPKKEDEMPSYQSPRTGNDQSAFNDVQPLYFTSMNPDRQKKKVKKPVNPKNRSQGSFLSKFFNKDKP